VPADKIKVTVSKGWVTLGGEVDWPFEKDEAEKTGAACEA
jgi:osmotically-inducible protein OsmY